MNRKLSQALVLPPDIRLMNTLSRLFFAIFVVIVLVLGVVGVMRLSLFSLSAIEVHGDLTHNNVATLRANVTPRLAGNFFTVDLTRTRQVFESVPWVRQVVVKRQFPDRLKVTLQEHEAVAFWGSEEDTRLVNTFGEVFDANQGDVESEGLPLFNGPTGQAGLVMQGYQMLAPILFKLDAAIERLELTRQGSWRAHLDTGAVLELGHGSVGDIESRVNRFVSTLTQISTRFGREVETADLRYGNGYALKLKGVITVNPGDVEQKKVKR